MRIQPDRDALIIVDQQLDFEPGGALAVPDGDSIVDPINRLAAGFTEVIVTQDHHPRGHISFASSYLDRPPFTVVTGDDVAQGRVTLSETAAFTLDELGVYLREARGGIQTLWPDHCIIGTPGEGLDPRLDLSRATSIVRKGYRPAADSYSAFCENDALTTGLAESLTAKGIERVVVVGLAGDYCVLFTAIDAAEAGFEAIYLEELTRFVGLPEGSRVRSLQSLHDAGVTVISGIPQPENG
jgi:nicotinamidase/pyrazinamidase